MIKSTQEPAPLQDTSSMEQVRELLFGSQLKQVEQRFLRQEESFSREIHELRESILSRLDSLENFMKSETASLSRRLQEEQAERGSMLKIEQRAREDALKSEETARVEGLKNEQRERAEGLARFNRALISLAEAHELKINKTENALSSVEQELRALMLAERNTLSAKMEERYQDALNALNSANNHLRQDLVYRSALSSLFAEAAIKLSNQLTMDLGNILENGTSRDMTHE